MSQRLAIDGGSPVRDQFLVFGAPRIGEAEIEEVVDTLRSGWIGTGPKAKRFESEFRDYIGCQHAIALNSCTAGLFLALDVLGIGPGDEVITTSMTFVSTANVIIQRGATPVFVDVERSSMNIDPSLIEAKITPQTKAVLPVHMAGRSCEMAPILDIARRHGLYVIEDAAHATEATYQGQKIGNISDITAFSFYATKNLTTGEGGMVTTNHREWAEALHLRSLHGLTRDAWKRYSESGNALYDCAYPGYKYNMPDIMAAIGLHQLARLEENAAIRQRHWSAYRNGLGDLDELILPSAGDHGRHAYHLYTILVCPEKLTISRNEFIAALNAENIGTGIHFIAVHQHSYYRQRYAFYQNQLPNTDYISERTISLPLSAKLSDEDIQDVVRAVRKIVAAKRRHNGDRA